MTQHRTFFLDPKDSIYLGVKEIHQIHVPYTPNEAKHYAHTPIGFRLTYIYEPRCEKTGLQGFRPGLTQTGLFNHRRWLEALNFGFR